MTNQQLWLSIGIPSFLIVLSWFQTNTRLSDFKAEVFRRLDQIETRLNKVEGHLERIDGYLRNFYGTDQKLEGRIDELSARVK